MKKNVFLVISLLCAALLFAGCALRPSDPDVGIEETEKETKPSETKKPTEDTTKAESVGDVEPDTDKETEHAHLYKEEKHAVSCEKRAYTVYTCECGHTYTEEDLSTWPLYHDYNVEVIEPTCKKDGLTRYTCKRCGYVFSEDFKKALGHSYEKGETVAPTVSSEGYTLYTCKSCKASYKGDTVSRLPDPNAPAVTPPADISGTSFDDCVFLGDSVSDMLEIYNKRTGIFGKATFLTETSYALYSYTGGKGVTYNGMTMMPEDAIKASGKTRVFIMLGTNDLVWNTPAKTVSRYSTLVANIKAKCPGVQIIIQSQTPVYGSGRGNSLTNPNVNEYNRLLREFAAANGCHFVDVATPLKDANGSLAARYTSDNYVHINGDACLVWHATLKAFLGI